MSYLATSAKAATRLDNRTAASLELIVAGSSQRSAVLERAVDLIQVRGAAPESLLVVTLTDSAARELTTRIRNRLNALGIKFNPNVMYAGTILSLCLRLLDEHHECTRLKRNYTVMDQFDQHYFLYQRLDDYRALANSTLVLGKDSARWNQAQNLLKQLNALTEQVPEATRLATAPQQEARALAACYKLYLQHLEKANALDHSTVQLATLRLLEEHTEVLAGLKNQLTYLIVDEQQESSIIVKRILRCLVDLGPRRADGDSRANYRSGQAPQRSQPPVRSGQSDTIPWWLM